MTKNVCDLTENDCVEIVRQYKAGAPLHMIAQDYDLFTTEIYEIISNRSDDTTNEEMTEELEYYA